jgi:regulator of RNase E activity RraA
MRYAMKPMPAALPAALVEKASRVETATVGHRRQLGFTDPGIKCVLGARRVAGTVVTLALPGPDCTLMHHIIQYLRPGDVLVVDRLGDRRHAALGGGVACAIKARGVAGVVIDGPCTDLPELEQHGLPVWSRGTSPVTARLYDLGGAFNLPVAIGGAAVLPGWLAVCDISGCVFIPPDEALAEVDWALEQQRAEPILQGKLAAGAVLGELSGATRKVEAALREA